MDRETAVRKLDELRVSMLDRLPTDFIDSRRSVNVLMDKAISLHLSSIYNEGFEVDEDFNAIEGCDNSRYMHWVSGIHRHIQTSENVVRIYEEFKRILGD